MAYTKQSWKTGDVITADKLNHMEDGIGSGGSTGLEMVLRFTGAMENNASNIITLQAPDFEDIEQACANGEFVQASVYYSLIGSTHGNMYLYSKSTECTVGDGAITLVFSVNQTVQALTVVNDGTAILAVSSTSVKNYTWTYDSATGIYTFTEAETESEETGGSGGTGK